MSQSAENTADLPRFAQITMNRDEAVYLMAIYAVAKAIHDTDEGKWQLRSNALGRMLYNDQTPFPGPCPTHSSFHTLAKKIEEAFKAADPEGYAELERDETGTQPLTATTFEDLLAQLLGIPKPETKKKKSVPKPEVDGSTPKKARRRRRKSD